MKRIDHIDGLRAIAVLSVLFSHIALHSANGSGPVYHFLMEGAHGVDLFFVLSGFCLAYPTLRTWRERGETQFRLTDFALKRLVRIVPPFYIATFTLLVAALIARIANHANVLTIPARADLFESLLFLDERIGLLNPSFWTLMVEFRWYLLFPILLLVWLRSPRAFCAIGVASWILYTFTRARGLDFGTLPGFMFGIIAADMAIGARIRDDVAAMIKRFALPLTVVCAAGGMALEARALIPGFEGADVMWAYQPTIVGWQIAMFFFVVAAGDLSWLRNALSSRPLVAIGVASYAIYLVHEPIVTVVVHHAVFGSIGFAVAAAIALATGFAFWFCAERPFTTGALRRPILERTLPIVRRCFAFAGIPEVMKLNGVERDTIAPVTKPLSRGTAAVRSPGLVESTPASAGGALRESS